MGPILFTMYTSPLESLIDQHGVNKMFYADDTQLYVAFKHTNLDDDCIFKNIRMHENSQRMVKSKRA